jgi:hypothetical protein
MPDVVNTPTVAIMTAAGLQNVTNPLFQYTFQYFPLDPTNFPTDVPDGWLATYRHTVRGLGEQLNGAGDFERSNAALVRDNLPYQTVSIFALHPISLSIIGFDFEHRLAFGPLSKWELKLDIDKRGSRKLIAGY